MHMLLSRSVLLVSMLMIYCGARAQTQYSGWLANFNTFRTGKKTSIHNDIQLRGSDEYSHVQTLLLRAGLNVAVRKNIIVTGGYAFVHNRRIVSGKSGHVSEHRTWEQLIINHKLSRVLVQHRFRVEQRFIGRPVLENGEVKANGHAFANRARYFLRNILPLKKEVASGSAFVKGPFAAIQNELFINFGNKANVNGKTFDQNRFYLAAGYRVQAGIDVEAGYLNQYISNVTGRTNNHVAQLAVYLRM